MARFSGLIELLRPQVISQWALGVRRSLAAVEPGLDDLSCQVALPPMSGSFNLLYRLDFSDHVSWVLRIPRSNKAGQYGRPQTRFIECEVGVMCLLRRHTSIPIPQVFSYSATPNNPLGVPFILMEFVSGVPVYDLWFKEDGQTPLETRRLRILDGVAACMAQLAGFSFAHLATLSPDPSSSTETPYPLNTLNEQAQHDALKDDIEPEFEYTQIGPFTSSQDYFKALLSMQSIPDTSSGRSDLELRIGVQRLVKVMIECLPLSIESVQESQSLESLETFVLAHPDFNVQNILVNEDGTIAAIIDWDNVHTVPRCIGYSRYPSWLTRDWDPMMYGYGIPDSRPENSPDELEFYRQYYSAAIGALRPAGSIDFTTKSHLYEAVWIAASSPLCIFDIVEKIFEYVFPEAEQEDQEYPLEYYDVVHAIAKDELAPPAQQRMYEAIRNAFSAPNTRKRLGD